MKNIILTGMPSSGKSTVGSLLASEMGMDFIDTDILIKDREKRELREIVKSDGHETFLRIQEEVLLKIDITGHVIATGGSVVYGDASMGHLKKGGIVIFLKSDFEDIQQRLEPGRRFAKPEGKSIHDVYLERLPLYEKYADVTIDCAGKSAEQIAEEIRGSINKYWRVD